jgi:6-pyruvoyltetrahydropterin/6-carboxytetrahydropterin synthase
MLEQASIEVRHHFEAAHRLFLTSGKCENIHGHSWKVALELTGLVDSANGMVGALDFSDVKGSFRTYLDNEFDHRLLLHREDPFAGPLIHSFEHDLVSAKPDTGKLDSLPGVSCFDYDPTTENVARTIGVWASDEFGMNAALSAVRVTVHETDVNSATWMTALTGEM